MKDNENSKKQNQLNAKQVKQMEMILTDIENKIYQLKSLIGKTQSKNEKNYHFDTKNAEQFVEGVFDGQQMIDEKGKKYVVPENYASKSKLVSGDKLKLVVAPNGTFIFKQIAPVARKREIGTIQKVNDKFAVYIDKKKYKVLQASVVYFKLNDKDKVTVLLPENKDVSFAAIENKLVHL